MDDTIETIKKKCIIYCEFDEDVKVGDIYLFSQKSPLGVTSNKSAGEQPPLNPYDVTKDTIKTLEERNTQNAALLMNEIENSENTIFMCLAQDIKVFARDNNFPEQAFIESYFPGPKNVSVSVANMKSIRQTDNKVSLFHEISYASNRDDVKSEGIRSLDLTIMPSRRAFLPSENIFKLIHATKNIPFIRQGDKIRLYAPDTALNGQPYPYLSIAKINNILKYALETGVNVYIIDNTLKHEILLVFSKNGDLQIKSEFTTGITRDEASEIITRSIQPVSYTHLTLPTILLV